MKLNIKTGVCGLFQLETFRVDEKGREIRGSRQIKAPWFSNLITNQGLNRMGADAAWKSWCQVGTGSTPPSVNDSQLASRVAATSTNSSTSTGAQSEEPYYGWSRTTKRFGAGVAAGNISEVGMGWGAVGSLFSRALVLDNQGNPTTIQVLADEFLDVVYEFRQYPPMEDRVDTITLGGIDYTYIGRASRVTTAAYWSQPPAGGMMRLTTAQAHNGDIGSVTGTPSGQAAGLTVTVSPYQTGSLKAVATVTAGPTDANMVNGIRSLIYGAGGTGNGSYQIQFDPPIPKTSDNTLSLTIEFSWARKII